MSILTAQVLPPGQYGWLHVAHRTADGTPDGIVKMAKAAGLRGILAKYHEDWAVINAKRTEPWAEEFRALVQPCADVGLLLIPWGYVTPVAHEPATTRLVAEAVEVCRPANPEGWYIFDPEIEWDRDPQSADKARMLFGALKQMAPGGRWLYSSWGWTDQHPRFPWAVWQHHCEGYLPQAYPNTLGIPDPDLAWNRSYGGAQYGGPQSTAWTGPQGFRELRPERPIIPALDIYNGVIPRLAELAHNWGVPAVTWWVMDNFGQETIRQLAATPYARPVQPPAVTVPVNPHPDPVLATPTPDVDAALAALARAEAEIAVARQALHRS